jgi:four helix bundle protein
MDLLYKTLSVSNTLPGEGGFYLGTPLFRAAVRSASDLIPAGDDVGKAEYRRMLNMAMAGCAEVNMYLSLIEKANLLDDAAMMEMSDRWNREQRRISCSLDKLSSDE